MGKLQGKNLEEAFETNNKEATKVADEFYQMYSKINRNYTLEEEERQAFFSTELELIQEINQAMRNLAGRELGDSDEEIQKDINDLQQAIDNYAKKGADTPYKNDVLKATENLTQYVNDYAKDLATLASDPNYKKQITDINQKKEENITRSNRNVEIDRIVEQNRGYYTSYRNEIVPDNKHGIDKHIYSLASMCAAESVREEYVTGTLGDKDYRAEIEERTLAMLDTKPFQTLADEQQQELKGMTASQIYEKLVQNGYKPGMEPVASTYEQVHYTGLNPDKVKARNEKLRCIGGVATNKVQEFEQKYNHLRSKNSKYYKDMIGALDTLKSIGKNADPTTVREALEKLQKSAQTYLDKRKGARTNAGKQRLEAAQDLLKFATEAQKITRDSSLKYAQNNLRDYQNQELADYQQDFKEQSNRTGDDGFDYTEAFGKLIAAQTMSQQVGLGAMDHASVPQYMLDHDIPHEMYSKDKNLHSFVISASKDQKMRSELANKSPQALMAEVARNRATSMKREANNTKEMTKTRTRTNTNTNTRTADQPRIGEGMGGRMGGMW